MARVTVEDCIEVIPNRFNLVIAAATRSRALSGGASHTVPVDNDKNPVVALREIAAQSIDIEGLHEDVLRKLQHVGFVEENDDMDIMDDAEDVDTLDEIDADEIDDVDDLDESADIDDAEDEISPDEDVDGDTDEDDSDEK